MLTPEENIKILNISPPSVQDNDTRPLLITISKTIRSRLIKDLSPYLIALRPWSFTASFSPVALGACLHYKSSASFDIGIFLTTLICAVSVHAAGNLVNTYYDYAHGVDSKKSDDRTLVDSLLTPNDVTTMGAVCYIIGCAAFFLICHLSVSPTAHIAIMYFGGLSGSFLYTGGLGLKYVALGDIVIFLTFGPLAVLFAYVCQGGSLCLSPLIHALPIAINAEAILHANNVRDAVSDAEAGIVTLAMLTGETGSYALFALFLFLPYLFFVVVAVNYSVYFGLPALTIFLVFPIEKRFRRGERQDTSRELAKLNLLLSVSYITACLLTPQKLMPFLD